MKLSYSEITTMINLLKREERESAESCEKDAKAVAEAKRRFQEWVQNYRKRVAKNGVDDETAEKTIDQAFEEMVTPYEENERVARAYHSDIEHIMYKITGSNFEI